MRISTQTLFETGANQLGVLQSSLVRTQQQISSGQRILNSSDDPIGAARALEITQSQSINTQYGANRQQAMGALTGVEGTLSSVTALLQEVQTTIVAAGNGVLSDNERGFQATELKGRLEALLGLANSRDALGNYQFSGYQTNTPAFVQTGTGALYQGDTGQQALQVEATRQMAIGNPGRSVFQGGVPGGPADTFKTLTDLINLLNTPVVTAADKATLAAGLATAGSNMNLSLDNVLTIRASVGSSLQELDALNEAGTDRNLQFSQLLSEIQDLDYTQALTQLSQQQFTLEAAQRSFSTISKLSLFNFI